MLPWLGDGFGNPSSLHAEGRRAKDAIDAARETLSSALGCLFAEVLFCSGGTEAANLALIGLALNNVGSRRNRILIGAARASLRSQHGAYARCAWIQSGTRAGRC